MSATDLLEFARGPALAFSLFVMIAGSAWRIAAISRLGGRTDLSEPRSTRLFAGAMRGIFGKMIPREEFRRREQLSAFNAYVYHIGLALIAFAYLPHIQFIERLTGLAWPALPAAVMYIAVGPTLVTLVIALAQRFNDPVRRLLSGFDDYFSWFVVVLPIVTGMAAIYQPPVAAALPGAPAYPLPLAIHLLSAELLFVWLPFGKLAHAFLVFIARGITGAALARKGAAI